jgi:hypothetical protein
VDVGPRDVKDHIHVSSKTEVIDFTFSGIFQCTWIEQVFQNGSSLVDLRDRTLSKLLRIYSFVDLASSLASQCGASFLDPLHVMWFVSIHSLEILCSPSLQCHVVPLCACSQ